ncbi:MAG: MFS transporter, partial [Caldimonas sp.]
MLPGVAFALPGGLLGQRFGDKRLVLIGLGLMGVGGLWLASASSLAEADAARFTSGIGAVMLNVLVTKMVTDLFDGNERLLAMSVLINSWPVGIGLALLVIGPLAELGGWRWGIAASAGFAAIGFALVSALPRSAVTLSQDRSPGIGLGVLTRREWRLLTIGSLPWLFYNAAFQIAISFLPSFLVGNGWGIASSGSLVALNTVLFVVSVQIGGVLLKRATDPDRLCHVTIVGWCMTLLLI